jgi:hypothetical protein
MRRIWALQIVWNFVFFSTVALLTGLENGKTTYTLTPGERPAFLNNDPPEKFWDYHFYAETFDGAKKEIGDDSEKATAFQKAITGRDDNPRGVNAEVELEMEFNALPSEAEARAYIDHYNAAHGDGPGGGFWGNLVGGFFVSLLVAAVCPFLWMFAEALGLGFIVMLVAHPILSAVIFGPLAYQVAKASGVFSGVGGAFRRRD